MPAIASPPSPPTSRRRPLVTGAIAALGALVVLALVVAVVAPSVPGGPALLYQVRKALPTSARNLGAGASARMELEPTALDAVNQARAARGLAPVALNPTILDVARARSEDMAVNHYFAHVAPDGSDVFGMLDQAGYVWMSAGENLYRSTLRDDGSIGSAVQFWSTSPEHAANLFSPNFNEAAVGVVEGSDGVYLTLVLASR